MTQRDRDSSRTRRFHVNQGVDLPDAEMDRQRRRRAQAVTWSDPESPAAERAQAFCWPGSGRRHPNSRQPPSARLVSAVRPPGRPAARALPAVLPRAPGRPLLRLPVRSGGSGGAGRSAGSRLALWLAWTSLSCGRRWLARWLGAAHRPIRSSSGSLTRWPGSPPCRECQDRGAGHGDDGRSERQSRRDRPGRRYLRLAVRTTIAGGYRASRRSAHRSCPHRRSGGGAVSRRGVGPDV
jgi:hypothetical protein